VQVDPIEPTLKAPGYELLKLKYDDLLSTFDFKYDLRHHSKVFLRAGQMAVLDMMRHKRLNSAATAIQKEVRCYQKRKEFLAFRRAIIVVAKWSRGMLARRLATGRGFRSSTSHLDVSRFCRQRPPDISRKKCSHQGEMWTSVSPLVVRRVGEECDECACSGSLCIFIFPMS